MTGEVGCVYRRKTKGFKDPGATRAVLRHADEARKERFYCSQLLAHGAQKLRGKTLHHWYQHVRKVLAAPEGFRRLGVCHLE